MQIICTSLQTDNHASTSLLNFYRLDALPDSQPIVSKYKIQIKIYITPHLLIKRDRGAEGKLFFLCSDMTIPQQYYGTKHNTTLLAIILVQLPALCMVRTFDYYIFVHVFHFISFFLFKTRSPTFVKRRYLLSTFSCTV